LKADSQTEELLRLLAPRVLGLLIRRHGQFDACEDAVQEALLAAAVQWPEQGRPDNPQAWLFTVASRRLTDQWRSDAARRQREANAASLAPTDTAFAPAPDDVQPHDQDDTLTLLFLCCHPALSAASQVALTLRAVGGLTTAQVARAFLVPEATIAQRISRAKQRIKATGIPFGPPPEAERPDRLRVVLHVLYLIFNEGYTNLTAPSPGVGPGSDPAAPDAVSASEPVSEPTAEPTAALGSGLTAEAVRLTREVHRLLPEDGEVTGLLALMLLTDARRAARSRLDGTLVPLAEQDRELWDRTAIREGTELITRALTDSPVGPYQLQAAIAALHAEAARAEDTDWPQILALYQLLERVSPGPVITLNHAVAIAMVHGPQAGLAHLKPLDDDDRMATHHRLDAVRAHLLEMAGDHAAAHASYLSAAGRATSIPERRYLEARAARLRQR
jgi:RNA polymerase sigma factor (sigma-70 family)